MILLHLLGVLEEGLAYEACADRVLSISVFFSPTPRY